MSRLSCLLILLVSILGANAAAEPPGDYEDVNYRCVCACFDYQATATRYRLPGGGYGTEYLHHPLFNGLDPQKYLTDHLVTARDAATCRRTTGACRGQRNHYRGDPLVPGWLGRCRWDVRYY